MNMMQVSFFAMLMLFILGWGAHILNVKRVHKRIELLEHKAVPKEKLFSDLYSCQGSNFNALALAAWILFITASFFLYLLTPELFPNRNYFVQLPWLASSWVGLALFGLLGSSTMFFIIMGSEKLPESLRCYRIAELYGYYCLSRNEKRAMIVAIPMLMISILISTHMATIHPTVWAREWWVAFILLIVSLSLLIWPMVKEMWEGRS
ncbi:hypothetical protein [Candidatus Methanocrinis natronophilus]|uniref:Uncharacterized protein n=1 Tax=Candidatus Methanocrinis natronophilus TaxID=3033396 RepID=A0ABT5X4U1_9EURY|nr:hypothetical protein [Candidatus Methanocrinis natronophilus]MDF0589685.1 hypothetical protein [Candidatus Methanocrinis natronophilus]